MQTLSRYSAMAVASLAITAELQAQTIYTNVDPDFALDDWINIPIDFDQDGNPELLLRGNLRGCETGFYSIVNVPELKASLYTNVYVAGDPWGADPFNEGDSIGPSLNFGAYSCLNVISSCYWLTYACIFEGDLMGVQIEIDGQTHYGWIRISVPWYLEEVAVLRDYGYNCQPGVPVAAGTLSPLSVQNEYAWVSPTDSIVINVLANDTALSAIDTASLSISVAPAQGTAHVAGTGLISYVPLPGTYGIDETRYSVCTVDSVCGEARLIL